MAADGERRMVFDVRGRRKHVIRAVYAILAVLMVSSLFFVVGPLNVGELLNRGGGSSNAAKIFDEQAERAERRLAKDPTNAALLLSLARTRINAGNSQVEVDSQTGAQSVTPEAREEYERALRFWRRYLNAAGASPNASAAALVAGTYFNLAVSAPSIVEAVGNLEDAAAAERIAAEGRPNVNSFSTLAIYEYYSGDFAAGDRGVKRAEALAPSKVAAKTISNQLAEYRKRGKQIQKQAKQAAKLEREKGKEELENPFGSLGGGGSSLGR